MRELLGAYDREIITFEQLIHQRLVGHRGYEAVQAIHGVGRILAAVFVAEIGDVTASRDLASCVEAVTA